MSSDHDDTSSWLRALAERLDSDRISEEEEHTLGPQVFGHVSNGDWRIRRLVATVLGELRYTDPTRIEIALASLCKDTNSYVSEAAARSSARRKSSRSTVVPATQSPVESQGEQLYEEVAKRIERIGVEQISARQIYDIASDFGNRAYAELAADTAHEFRSLMTPLEGGLVLMRRRMQEGQAPTQTQITSLFESLDLMKNLVEDLQVYGAYQIGPFERHDISTVLEEAVSLSRARSNSQACVSFDYDDEIGVTTVNVVRKRVLRSFVNVFTNSFQAMAKGGELRVSVGVDESMSMVLIAISDTGGGMTERQVRQALRRFGSTRKDEGGTGLGIPIAKKIIEEDHLGSFFIESIKGVGTTVRISLPVDGQDVTSG